MNKFLIVSFLFLWIFTSGCLEVKKQDEILKVFSSSDSLVVSTFDSSRYVKLNKIIDKLQSQSNENIRLNWTIQNLSESPKKINIVSRTLYDHNLYFYIFDNNNALKESKNIYWGMPNVDREADTYIPVKYVFLDAKESVNIAVSIKKSYRSNYKLFFDVSTGEIATEINFRKLIDAVFTAVLLLNILTLVYLTIKFKTDNYLWVYYLCYNLLILIAAFLRYFSAYISPIIIPAIFNILLEYLIFLAVFFYFCFGLLFIEYDKQLFEKNRKLAFFIVLGCLISLLSLNWAFHPLVISFRFGLLLILMFKFYQIIFSLRHQVFSKIFILLSGIFLMMTMLNSIYSNFPLFGFQNIYGLEFNKIIIMIESFLLFGGLLFRQKVKKRTNILSFF